jgi:hypothetical protein
MQRCMDMLWQDSALGIAGFIGLAVAIFHGIIVQRRMVAPFAAVARQTGQFSGAIRRIVPPLLHFSTMVWLLGGLALLATPWMALEQRVVVAGMVGAVYLPGVVFNFWATRGRHPGWMLLALAVGLIAAGMSGRVA